MTTRMCASGTKAKSVVRSSLLVLNRSTSRLSYRGRRLALSPALRRIRKWYGTAMAKNRMGPRAKMDWAKQAVMPLFKMGVVGVVQGK
jgi:hypothetical protein